MDARVGALQLELLACPVCAGGLHEDGNVLECAGEDRHRYAVEDGVPVLLSERDELGARYLDACNALALEDIATPLEYDRATRHRALVAFARRARPFRLLDIGTGTGQYLGDLGAAQCFALDIALPFLQAMPDRPGITRVCGDAQELPFRSNSFDVVVLSDVLEHVLDAHAVAAEVLRVCTPDATVFVHVPWKEDLSVYADTKYEFAHLRSFNSYTFAAVWHRFYIRRQRPSYPNLSDPVLFPLADRLPQRVRGLLSYLYFSTSLPTREYERRRRWIAELPRRERLLLRIYPPLFLMAELTPLENSRPDRLRQAVREWFEERRGRPGNEPR